jgi:uncharacterized membrane protein
MVRLPFDILRVNSRTWHGFFMTLAPSHRRLEIDLLRSAAVIVMVIFHGAYDLQMYYHWPIDVFRGVWHIAALITAPVFLLISGASAWLSWNRHRSPTLVWQKAFRRGALILALAATISAVTYIIEPVSFIRFGILHLIGVSALLLPLFVRTPRFSLGIGIVCVCISWVLPVLPCDQIWKIVLNCSSSTFVSVDYFPIFPWFGWILIGLGIGREIYSAPDPVVFNSSSQVILQKLTWPGKQALIIYLLHQPVLLLIFWLLLRP